MRSSVHISRSVAHTSLKARERAVPGQEDGFWVANLGAVNSPGFALDAIRIPELHFQDGVTSDNGWISNGFVRSPNVLPEHYVIQALIYHGAQFTVSEVPADLASGEATLKIANYGGSARRGVLIISASAAETTQLAHYQIDIHVG
jgi:immune inhibitor A